MLIPTKWTIKLFLNLTFPLFFEDLFIYASYVCGCFLMHAYLCTRRGNGIHYRWSWTSMWLMGINSEHLEKQTVFLVTEPSSSSSTLPLLGVHSGEWVNNQREWRPWLCNLCQWRTLWAVSYLFILFSLGVPQVTLLLWDLQCRHWGTFNLGFNSCGSSDIPGHECWLSIYQRLFQGFFLVTTQVWPWSFNWKHLLECHPFSHCTGPLCKAFESVVLNLWVMTHWGSNDPFTGIT